MHLASNIHSWGLLWGYVSMYIEHKEPKRTWQWRFQSRMVLVMTVCRLNVLKHPFLDGRAFNHMTLKAMDSRILWPGVAPKDIRVDNAWCLSSMTLILCSISGVCSSAAVAITSVHQVVTYTFKLTIDQSSVNGQSFLFVYFNEPIYCITERICRNVWEILRCDKVNTPWNCNQKWQP